MRPSFPTESDAPFGSRKRDWTFIWRAVVFFLSAFSAVSLAIGMYAANSYIKDAASTAIAADILPLRQIPVHLDTIDKTLEERKAILQDYKDWRVKKDEIDLRLTLLIENQQQMVLRQQVQLDKQSDLINQLARTH